MYDVFNKEQVKIKKPDFYKHVKYHKNGKRTEVIIGAGNHPRVGNRVRNILHKQTY